MKRLEKGVIGISLSEPSETEKVVVIDICSSPSSEMEEEEETTPLRPIFCLKSKMGMKELEEREECFILDFDPDHSIDVTVSKTKNLDFSDSPDISVISMKGQVACRDYPHSRHLCGKYQFEKTPHESYCELCYCYVCDVAAPCKLWSGKEGHCHAVDNEAWRYQREVMRKR